MCKSFVSNLLCGKRRGRLLSPRSVFGAGFELEKRAEEMWKELRRCEKRREEMRRHKMSWHKLRRVEKSCEGSQVTWEEMRTAVISWEELRKGEKTWDEMRCKNWEDMRWVEMRCDDTDCGDSGMQWTIFKRSCDAMRSYEMRKGSTFKNMASDWQVKSLLLRSTGGLPVTYRHSLCSAL